MKDKLKKIDNKWVRLAALIIVAINSSAMIFDIQLLPFENDEVVAGISVSGMVVVELWNHWKNNSWTQGAQQADRYFESMFK